MVGTELCGPSGNSIALDTPWNASVVIMLSTSKACSTHYPPSTYPQPWLISHHIPSTTTNHPNPNPSHQHETPSTTTIHHLPSSKPAVHTEGVGRVIGEQMEQVWAETNTIAGPLRCHCTHHHPPLSPNTPSLNHSITIPVHTPHAPPFIECYTDFNHYRTYMMTLINVWRSLATGRMTT